MVHQKDGGQVGKTISPYKILEKFCPKVGGQVGRGSMPSLMKNYKKLVAQGGRYRLHPVR